MYTFIIIYKFSIKKTMKWDSEYHHEHINSLMSVFIYLYLNEIKLVILFNIK